MPTEQPDSSIDVTFYGVRGSLPAPQTAEDAQRRLCRGLYRASQAGARFESEAEAERWAVAHLPLHERATHGGDTTCILVRCGETRLIIDAGSGIRRLGRALMPELFDTGRLEVHMLFTHMHLDHIMGFAFFSPLFMPKRRFDVRLIMHGGDSWQADLQSALSSTVSPPLFPVELDKLAQEMATLEYRPIFDGLTMELGRQGDVRVFCRRLHHPNETYGFRIEYGGKVFTVATDTEPFAGRDPRLQELVADADLIYCDAQFDWEQYVGDFDGLSRVGWGHGYAEWCGRYAAEARVRMAVMGHHDPAASDERIHAVGERMRGEFPNTVVGWDGLRTRIEEDRIIAFGAGEGGCDYIVPRV